MTATYHDLHGSAPDQCSVALLLIDVINDFDFPEAEQLLTHARPMAENIAMLKNRVKVAGIPVIYINDNFGRWRSDFRAQVQHCLKDENLGREIVALLHPDKQDYFVLKPKHSGFFSTTLDTLLDYLGVQQVILCGVATNICVLFTANDAYMRDLRLLVPRDCVAANTSRENDHALEQMKRILKADTRASHELNIESLLKIS